MFSCFGIINTIYSSFSLLTATASVLVGGKPHQVEKYATQKSTQC